MVRPASRVCLAAAFVCVWAGVALAQGQTTTSTATETKAFEVISVNATTLVLQLPEGPREMAVSDATSFMVDGQPMAVRDLQPGMKGVATITTTTYTTPVSVTEVKNGEVVMAGAGNIVIRTADGETKSFSQEQIDKRGVVLTRDGKPAVIADFKTGDKLSATIISAAAPRVVREQALRATLEPPPAAEPVAQAAALTPEPEPLAPPDPPAVGTSGDDQATPGAVATSGREDALPNTASDAPAIALAGVTALAAAGLLSVRRRRRET